MQPQIDDLRAFVEVAEHESFSAAAGNLFITQSALSRRLQKLEGLLGTRLIDRTSRTVGLTAVGEAFLPNAMRVIQHMDRAVSDIRDLVDQSSGTVVMASTRTVASTVLPSAIKRYTEKFAGMKVRVLDGIGESTARFVLNGEAEFGIVLVEKETPGLKVTPIIDDPFVLACHEDHPLAAKRKVKWSDLKTHRYIRIGLGTGNERILTEELDALDLLPNWVLEAQHVSTVMAFVEAQAGVSAVPRITIERFRGARIVTRPLVDPVIRRGLGVLVSPDRSLSPAAQELHNIVVKEMQAFGSR